MTKNTFIFNFDWADALNDQPDDVRLAVYDALIVYAKTGKEPQLQPMAKLAFSFIKRQIDRNAESYDAMVEARRAAGRKGGEAKASNAKQNLASVAGAIFAKQNIANLAYNDNDSDIENDIDSEIEEENVKEENGEGNSPSPTHTPKKKREREFILDDSKLGQMNKWMLKHTPYLAKNIPKPFSSEELDKLLECYVAKQICNVLLQIENRRDKRNKYVSLYLTVLNWLRMEYGQNGRELQQEQEEG